MLHCIREQKSFELEITALHRNCCRVLFGGKERNQKERGGGFSQEDGNGCRLHLLL